MRPTGWTVAWAIALTLEAMGQARPFWLFVGGVMFLGSMATERLLNGEEPS